MREGRAEKSEQQQRARKGEGETEAEKKMKQADQITQVCKSFATPGLVFAFLCDIFMLGWGRAVVPYGELWHRGMSQLWLVPLTVTLGQTSVSV